MCVHVRACTSTSLLNCQHKPVPCVFVFLCVPLCVYILLCVCVCVCVCVCILVCVCVCVRMYTRVTVRGPSFMKPFFIR